MNIGQDPLPAVAAQRRRPQALELFHRDIGKGDPELAGYRRGCGWPPAIIAGVTPSRLPLAVDRAAAEVKLELGEPKLAAFRRVNGVKEPCSSVNAPSGNSSLLTSPCRNEDRREDPRWSRSARSSRVASEPEIGNWAASSDPNSGAREATPQARPHRFRRRDRVSDRRPNNGIRHGIRVCVRQRPRPSTNRRRGLGGPFDGRVDAVGLPAAAGLPVIENQSGVAHRHPAHEAERLIRSCRTGRADQAGRESKPLRRIEVAEPETDRAIVVSDQPQYGALDNQTRRRHSAAQQDARLKLAETTGRVATVRHRPATSERPRATDRAFGSAGRCQSGRPKSQFLVRSLDRSRAC